MSGHTAPTSRAREKPTGDEEASTELKLGEFAGVPTLSLSEARLLINAVIEHRKQTHRRFVETESVAPPSSSASASSSPSSFSLFSSSAAGNEQNGDEQDLPAGVAKEDNEAEKVAELARAVAAALDPHKNTALISSGGIKGPLAETGRGIGERQGDRVTYISADGLVRPNRTLLKMQDYLDVFARFKNKENIEAVERLLAAHAEFENFEKSQLGTLCCETADEAKTLIPSIATKVSDTDLQELLDEITKLRQFTE